MADGIIDVLVIRDRSGSMQSARHDHEGGLRAFVETQQKVPGEVRFTLIQFDTGAPCEVVCDRIPLDQVTPQHYALVPRGGTPLLDAMGLALDHLTKHHPEEVICMVITDGEENASTEWTRARLKARIADLEQQHWAFLFLGANIDSFGEAAQSGIAAATTMNFNNHSPQSVGATYAAMASNAGLYRSARSQGLSARQATGSLTFTNTQRAAAMSTTVVPPATETVTTTIPSAYQAALDALAKSATKDTP